MLYVAVRYNFSWIRLTHLPELHFASFKIELSPLRSAEIMNQTLFTLCLMRYVQSITIIVRDTKNGINNRILLSISKLIVNKFIYKMLLFYGEI